MEENYQAIADLLSLAFYAAIIVFGMLLGKVVDWLRRKPKGP